MSESWKSFVSEAENKLCVYGETSSRDCYYHLLLSNEIHGVSIISITYKISHDLTSPRSSGASCCTRARSSSSSLLDLTSRKLQYCEESEHATTSMH